MPSGYRINPEVHEELGFLPLLAAAPSVVGSAGKLAGGLVKGIGGLFGGKKKKKAAPAPTPTAKPAAAAASARSSASKAASASAKTPALAGIPTDVKADALAALKTYQQAGKADKQNHAELVQKLSSIVKPAIDKMQADVKQAALQREVTNEHNRLVKEDQRWKDNERSHAQIMAKFDALEKSLLGSNAQTKRIFKIYGVNV